MPGIIHITEPPEFASCGDGIQCVLRSNGVRYDFYIERHHARAGAAEVWRMVDAIEQNSASVHVLRKKRR